MSVIRLFHWKCSVCNKEVTKADFGLPKKWIALSRTFQRKEIKHLCPSCQEHGIDENKYIEDKYR